MSATKNKRLIGGNHGGGGHEEPWLVSYADMMTLLFGFFVILFSLSQMDENRFSAVGRELAEAFNGAVDKREQEVGMLMEARQIRALQMLIAMLNLGDMEKVIEAVEKRMTDAKTLEQAKELLLKDLKKDEKALEEFRLGVLQKDDEVEIGVPDGMLFESGTADLTPKAKVGMKKLAGMLLRIKDLAGLEVAGHTDSLPPSRTSKFPTNWSLSAARAGAVVEELLKHGLDPKRMATRGMASLQPLFPERRADGSLIVENLSKNRRVTIRVRKVNGGGPVGALRAPASSPATTPK